MKPVYLILLLLVGLLQYQLWCSNGGILELNKLKSVLVAEKDNLAYLRDQNAKLFKQIRALKTDLSEIESRARSEHNMVMKGEIFYQIVER